MMKIDKLMTLAKTLWPRSARPAVRDKINELIKETVDFDNHETMLIRNIMGLRDITATDVMIPRADIISVDINDDMDAIISKIVNANHSRIPVTNGSLDDVIGIVHVKDVARCLAEKKDLDLMAMLRQPINISPTMRMMDLLQEMRLHRLHLAFVIDEYGGTDGLITIEDLVEEIVGEINDEHDDDIAPVFDQHPDGTAVAEARLEIAFLEGLTGSLLDDEERDEIETLGGLVISLAGRVPGRGEIVRHASGLEFEVLESDPRQVNLLRICGLNKMRQDLHGGHNLDQVG